jgi:hypothetical protein
MIRAAKPSGFMHHPCVLDNKAAGINAVETEQGQNRRKSPLMTPMSHSENFLQAHFMFEIRAEFSRPIVEVSGDDQGSFRRHMLVNISHQLTSMFQTLAVSQTKMRADQGERLAILHLHVRMQNGPRLLLGGFRKSLIPPVKDGKTAEQSVALNARREFHRRSTDAMLQFLLKMIQKAANHRILRDPKLLQHHDIALLTQDGLNQALLDRFFSKGTATEMQVVA